MDSKRFSFDELKDADLVVDALYEGGTQGNWNDEPMSKLMNVENQGGFRIRGDKKNQDYCFVVLFSSLNDSDWPDRLDLELGEFVYYGDNKKPGHLLHETNKGGNRLLSLSLIHI